MAYEKNLRALYNLKNTKFLISLLSIALILLFFTPSTNGRSSENIPPEIELGRKVFEEIRQHLRFVENPILLKYLNDLGMRILSGLPYKNYEFRFFPIISNDINAFALSNGYIFITNQLIQTCESEEELAFVFSHEISHVLCNHLMNFLSHKKKVDIATVAIMILSGLISKDSDLREGIPALSFGLNQNLALSYSREQENEADTYGLKYLADAGYDIKAAPKFMEKLRLLSQITIFPPAYLSTHPPPVDRILKIKQYNTSHNSKPLHPPIYNFKRIKLLSRLETDLSMRIMADLTSAHLNNPNDIDAIYGIALLKEKTGDSEEAEKYYKKGLNLSPKDMDIIRDYGIFLYRRGRLEEAEAKLKMLTISNPKEFIPYHYIGRIKMDQNQPDNAIKAFLQSKEIYPEFPDNYNFLGILYSKKGDEEKSHEYFEKYFTLIGNQNAAMLHSQKKGKKREKEFE